MSERQNCTPLSEKEQTFLAADLEKRLAEGQIDVNYFNFKQALREESVDEGD